MVKDFIRKLVAIVACIFLLCLALCLPGAVLFSNEIVETLFKNKAVWLFALLLALGSTEGKATSNQKVKDTSRTIKSSSHKTVRHETQELYDDETLISPRSEGNNYET